MLDPDLLALKTHLGRGGKARAGEESHGRKTTMARAVAALLQAVPDHPQPAGPWAPSHACGACCCVYLKT